jgi:hypothetical protein
MSTSVTGQSIKSSPIIERPLTENETKFLQGILKNGAVPALRVLGALTGFSALTLVIGAASGLPMQPGMYAPMVMITGILGMIFGGTSQSLRFPIRRVLAKGTAHEAYGVPEIGTGSARSVPVTLAGLSFQLKPRQAKRLLPGRMNRIAYAEAGPSGGRKGKRGLSVALALEWNGTSVSKRETFLLKTEPTGATK